MFTVHCTHQTVHVVKEGDVRVPLVNVLTKNSFPERNVLTRQQYQLYSVHGPCVRCNVRKDIVLQHNVHNT